MRISLNIKFALAAAALFLICAAAGAWLTSKQVEDILTDHLEQSLRFESGQAVAVIDYHLEERRTVLVKKAALITADLVGSPVRAQRFLDDSVGLKTLFTQGLYLFAQDGTLLAESPKAPELTTRNFAFREYFKETVRLREPVISSPFISAHRNGKPVLMITAPVFGADGSLIGMLGGTMQLAEKSLFHHKSDAPLPHKGYYALITGDRTIIMHKDASLIMTKKEPSDFSALSANAALEPGVAMHRTSQLGVEVISMARRLKTTGWLLTVNDDKADVYAPIYRMQGAFIIILGLGCPVVVLLIFALSRIITSPLRSLTGQVQNIQDASDASQRVTVASRDEVKNLAVAVNSMLDTISESQRMIQEKERFFSTWYGRSKDAICFFNHEWRVLDCNEAALGMFGPGSRESAVLASLLPDAAKDIQAKVRAEGFLKDYEAQLTRPDGTQATVLFSCEAAREDSGIPNVYLAVFRDITEQVKLTQQLRHSQKLEAVGQIAGGVAHDFNNILCAMIGFCDLAKMKTGEDHPARTYLHHIAALTERGANLTKSLLAFSRKQILAVRPEHINRIIEGMGEFLRRIIGTDIRLETAIAGEDLVVMADRGQIEQVLMNLATNARDAMPGGGSLRIGVARCEIDEGFVSAHGYGAHGTYAVVTVEDSGAGMDEKTMEKIFEPFFTTKDEGKGTGLGMSIAYGIIKQHKGFINVYSEVGSGTVFRIYLPLVKQQPAPAEKDESPANARGTETILIVEDDATLRSVLQSVLSEFGYRVIEAADGSEAAELFRRLQDEIDLVLMDVVMPEMGGKASYSKIRSIRPNAKVIFISGYTADHLSAKSIREEGLHFVSKPVSPQELLRKIREVLSG
ncbi:MAG: multi-sensor hybrid histidine kinase [Nitrospirae bacterium]|nr:MAG: multi-sensor hybrid histidine kinase [Nitrospirota bacterium]